MVKVCTAKQLEHLKELLSSGGDVSIAVAYVDRYGFNLIEKCLKATPSKVEKVRLLVDLKSGSTHPDAVKRMVELSEEEGARFECKEYYIKGHRHAILHSKLFISNSGNSVTFLTGSFNLTQNALERNEEHGLWVDCTGDKGLADRTQHRFDKLWGSDQATIIDDRRASKYAEYCQKSQEIEETRAGLEAPESRDSEPRYWLFRCDVTKYRFSELLKENHTGAGDILYHQLAPGYMFNKYRTSFKQGDHILFYHSNAKPPALVGTARVMRGTHNILGSVQIIQADQEFNHPVTLQEIKRNPKLQDMMLATKSGRTKLQIVTREEFAEIVALGKGGDTP